MSALTSHFLNDTRPEELLLVSGLIQNTMTRGADASDRVNLSETEPTFAQAFFDTILDHPVPIGLS